MKKIKNLLPNLIVLAFGVLGFFNTDLASGASGGVVPLKSGGEAVPNEGDSVEAQTTVGETEVLPGEGDVEYIHEGEATTPYPFEGQLAAAINAGIGDTSTDNPGQVVVSEFVRLLGERGIGPEAFAGWNAEGEVAPTTASN